MGSRSHAAFSTSTPPLNDYHARTPTIDVDDQGRLVIAWSEGVDSAAVIHVRRLEDGLWDVLGTLDAFPGNTTSAESPALQVDNAGAPVVAWVEQGDTINESIHVRRWNGSTWEPYGEAVSADGGRTEVRAFTLQVDSSGRPVVAWVQTGLTYVRRWNGSAWVALGDTLHGEQRVQATFFSVVEVDATGRPLVASSSAVEGEVPTHLLVQRWEEGRWVSLGGPLSAVPGRTSVDRVFSRTRDRDGYPVLAWAEFDGLTNKIYVYAYNH